MRIAPTAFVLCLAGSFFGPPAHAITKQAALQILGEQVLVPSANDDEICAWITPAPIPAGIIETVDGDVSVDLASFGGNPQWFAYIDLEPCALLEHPVSYVFIDNVTGAVNAVPADNWPTLDGDEILEDDARVGGKLIFIYPAIPRPDPKAPAPAGTSNGDYGGAPEGAGLNAYPGVPGRFPTLLGSPNAWPGRTGVFTGVKPVPEVMLGNFVSTESSPLDPADPDGRPNLVDADDDERVFFTYDPNTSPARASIIFDVTLAGAVPSVPHILNVAVDLDNNGRWENLAGITEWAVINHPVPLPAVAGTYTRVTPEFDWTGAAPEGPTLAWVRMLLTRNETIPVTLFGPSGWDGSGSFTEGEVEDYKFYRDCCPGEGCPPPPGDGDDDDDEGENPPPSEEKRWDGTPMRRYALVVQGPDRAGDTALKEAADNMEKLFQTQGYDDVTRLNHNSKGKAQATTANILQWFCDVKAKVICEDKIMVYFIAHGVESTPGGSIHLRRKRSGDSGFYSGAELAAALAKIPPCPPGSPNFYTCNTPQRCCDVTVIMESCFAGQWLSSLMGSGRRIITSSEGSTKSYYSPDGNGCAYSDSYRECAKPSNKDTVDGSIPGDPADGDTDPSELHDWAARALGSPFGNRQVPQVSNMVCKCDCPPFWWDCICDFDPFDGIEVGFFPGQLFGAAIGPIGQSFMSPPFPPPPIFLPLGNPLYDFVGLPEDAVGWEWEVQMDAFGAGLGFLQLQGQFFNIAPGEAIDVPLFLTDPAQFPLPPEILQLQVDLGGGQYQLRDPFADPPNDLLLAGLWEDFQEDIEFDARFLPIPAYRSNLAPGFGQFRRPVNLEGFGPAAADGDPLFMNLNWDPGQHPELYFVECSTDLANWVEVAGPLINSSYTLLRVVGQPRRFYRVRVESASPGPVIIPVGPGDVRNAQPGVPENFVVDASLFDPITPLGTINGFLDGEDLLQIDNLPPPGQALYDPVTGIVSLDLDGDFNPEFDILQMDPGLTTVP